MPRIDLKFDAGSVITLAIALVAGAAAYGSIRSDLAWLKQEVATTRSEVREIRDRLAHAEQELKDRPAVRVRIADATNSTQP